MNRVSIKALAILFSYSIAFAQTNPIPRFAQKFEQMGPLLPTPNEYRTASGTPGPKYWQQRADYDMQIELNDEKQEIYGSETITYFNNSPHELPYLWLQLDQNHWDKHADHYLTYWGKMSETIDLKELQKGMAPQDSLGYKLLKLEANGKALKYAINKTMLRIDLPKALKSGEKFTFRVDWQNKINDRIKTGGRSGYEYFSEDKNYLYCIAQFYPRLAAFTDYSGWQNKQFLGDAEFACTFGNYSVKITVPSDHILGATGVLQNPKEAIQEKYYAQFVKAQQTFEKPIIIASQNEAEKRERSKAITQKTWHFKAENVRDFAFATSRKFIWDGMMVDVNGKKVLAMSLYPKEGNPLWEKYSTHTVAHTLQSYSRMSFDYPYPVAYSVHSDNIGMEYPMICFNWGRPEKDGTYSARVKNAMISVIIHEIGHNFFPMIVNNDERQWAWMDEGINSFLEFIAEQEWDRTFPSRRGPAWTAASYMKSPKENQEPIMTNPEQISQLGNNTYTKVAAALNVLRETVLGRELFDFAFKEYARKWMFKSPTPADFFRTMEEASGTDLDWFWKAWFYGTEHVDVSLESVRHFKLDAKNPSVEWPAKKKAKEERISISEIRNKESVKQTYMEAHPELKDFYDTYDEYRVTEGDMKLYQDFLQNMDTELKPLYERNLNYYELRFKNLGGVVTPLVLLFTFTDGSKEEIRIPAEIWRRNEAECYKIFAFEKELKQVQFDPYLELADADESNNVFPKAISTTRFDVIMTKPPKLFNPMKDAKMK
ncbi:MAG TPA: aminopeptidase [Cytophagales bacterium]|nr:aminopeptidase [Cytophagales bacterium]